jgi:hypothetical protein
MTERERYLFDLQGYLTLPAALTASEVDALNALLDDQVAAEMGSDESTRRFLNLLTWGQPFIDLLDHPRLYPYLEAMLGTGLRLDHLYLDVIRSGLSPIGATLHGGATPASPIFYYRYADGSFHNGLTVMAINLHDVNPGDGGFACVPGSHKSNLPLPANCRDLQKAESFVERVTGPAGTVLFFTEALTHGPLPWTGTRERRTIFIKYSPSCVAWAKSIPDPDDFPSLTDRQRALLRPPSARY